MFRALKQKQKKIFRAPSSIMFRLISTCVILTISACGSGSKDELLEASPLVTESSTATPIELEAADQYEVSLRALYGAGAGPWSDPLIINSTMLSDYVADVDTPTVRRQTQANSLIEWTHDGLVLGYEVVATNPVSGAVMGELSVSANDICERSVCQLQPTAVKDTGNNQPPVARVSAVVTEGYMPLTVLIDANASSDPENQLSAYKWSVTGRYVENADSPSFNYTFDEPGQYRILLTVTDEHGAADVAHSSVIVVDPALSSLTAIADIGFIEVSDLDVTDSAADLQDNSQDLAGDTAPPVVYVVGSTDITTPDYNNAPYTVVIDNETPTDVVANEIAGAQNSLDQIPAVASAAQVDAGEGAEVSVQAAPSQVVPAPQALVQAVPAPEAPVQAVPAQAAVSSPVNATNTVDVTAPELGAALSAEVDTKPEVAPAAEAKPSPTIVPELVVSGSTGSASAPISRPVDRTAPVISDVVVSSITSSSVDVTWQLSERATGQIEFGLSDALGQWSRHEASFNWDHHIQRLQGLSPDTTYYLRIHAKDSSANSSVSKIITLKTGKVEIGAATPVSNSVQASPVVTVSEGWPSNTNGDLPMAGIFYGNHVSGVAAANAGIGVESTRRFRAERTGDVSYVRYHNRTLNDYNIKSRCESFGAGSQWCGCVDAGLDEYTCGYTLGSSYHVGNGGTIVVEMRPDDGSGLPSNTVLGKTEAFIPMDNSGTHYPALQFTSPVRIQEGVIYHLVFTNLTPPTTCELTRVSPQKAASCPRNQGAMGLNGNFMINTPSTTGRRGPFRGDSAAANYFRRSAGDEWRLYELNLSWYELGYVDGVAVGESYTSIDSSRTAVQTIGGSIKARQIFTVRDATRKVDGLWLNFGHTNSADGSSLSVVLKDSDGQALATGAITSSALCRQRVKDESIHLSHWCQDWSYTSFGETVSLLEGSEYSVEFSGGSKSGFKLSAYEPLNGHGFTDRNYWQHSHVEISKNSGASWQNWMSVRPSERDLALLFTIEGMPRQLR